MTDLNNIIYVDSQQVAIVTTDGQQTKRLGEYTPLDIASDRLKDKGVKLFVVGFGSNVDSNELQQIASSYGSVFTSAGFDYLSYVVKLIAEKACPASKGPLSQ